MKLSQEYERQLVMCIDDEPMILELVGLVARHHDCDFVSASSAEKAMSIIHRDKPDFIFLDIQMPGEDGVEFCRRIFDEQPDHSAPIVFLTGNQSKEVVDRAIAAGGSD